MAAWRNGIASDYDRVKATFVSGDCRFDPCGGHFAPLMHKYLYQEYNLDSNPESIMIIQKLDTTVRSSRSRRTNSLLHREFFHLGCNLQPQRITRPIPEQIVRESRIEGAGLLERGDVLGRQDDIERLEVAPEVLDLPATDDGEYVRRLLHDIGDGDYKYSSAQTKVTDKGEN